MRYSEARCTGTPASGTGKISELNFILGSRRMFEIHVEEFFERVMSFGLAQIVAE
jgi:hypothetical protein